jgi:hypothetical protein
MIHNPPSLVPNVRTSRRRSRPVGAIFPLRPRMNRERTLPRSSTTLSAGLHIDTGRRRE